MPLKNSLSCLSVVQWGASHLPRPSASGPAHPELTPSGGQGGRASSRQRAQCSPSRISPIRWAKPGAGSHAPCTPARTSQAHPRLAQLGRGRAGAQRVQLTSPGTAPGAVAHTPGRPGSVDQRELRRGPGGPDRSRGATAQRAVQSGKARGPRRRPRSSFHVPVPHWAPPPQAQGSSNAYTGRK
ncbi:hypothetical protein NDU88_004003 [Pleurodeles waltl]|uniref:Uncharacterized protein n=1 Tax=Pleurodeles waltl TaxID=8319 RepID=A0AAV7LTG4_PLEWA|nr:hypothetical protein NDU88_004003 [Pleurodeles waltl]